MRRQSRLLLAGGIVLLAAPSHAFETQNRELAFTLALPDGFEQLATDEDEPDVVCAYAAGDPDDEASFFIITVERLGKTLPKSAALDQDTAARARQLADQFGQEAEVRPIVVRWEGFYLEMTQAEGTARDVGYVRHAVEIPLKREAVRLTVLCDFGNADSGESLLRELVAGLEGRTNWSSGGLLRRRLPLKIAGAIVGSGILYLVIARIRRANSS